MEITGRVHSFQSLGTVDGPGVRCVVFMQGCPLHCVCCHNPDTWDVNGGELASADEVFSKVLRCKNYFGTKGGLTVSGGEPLMQTEFVTELFTLAHENGINTCLDTSGCVLDEKVKSLLDVTDLVLLDIKYTDEDSYKRYTGIHYSQPLEFLDYLENRKISAWIRQVIIPSLNDTAAQVRGLKSLCDKYTCIHKIELLPFRKLCTEKYKAMKRNFPLENTPEASQEKMCELNSIIGI